MNYNINQLSGQQQKTSSLKAVKKLYSLIAHEKRNLIIALIAILVNSSLQLVGPLLIGHAVDAYVTTKQYNGVLMIGGILLAMYLLALGTSYMQTKLMGSVGQRTLFTLRNALFNKLQELPIAFFNQNKAGDLISRLNNDTDKINQFFSQSLMQFIGSIVTMTGAGVFLLAINIELGAATLLPALLILIFTMMVSPWVKRKNATNLKSVGSMSAEIQESLNNFRVIIAFNRRDYFLKRFNDANHQNYNTAIGAGMANNVFLPVYGLFSSLAQLIVLALGIYLISTGSFTIGLLVSYLAYAVNFYNPLRQLAALWTSFQVAMAGWDRISQILSLQSNLTDRSTGETTALHKPGLAFQNVSFAYPNGSEILHHVSFDLLPGKTYALVGPTGGGKTTTASLIARLYDPTHGTVFLNGRDIRTYSAEERAKKISFILQEPILFTGTVKDNLLYGNEQLLKYNNEELEEVIKESHLQKLLSVFEQGLDTPVSASGESISLGQKQLIAFMRAVLRNPEILILDEASANIDTVTEHLLTEILDQLPEQTTRVIIAHRLNTIEKADEIFFVNSGNVIPAGSLDHAVEMLMQGKRAS
ncbi:ABC transporter ATP-binding protein [Segetibacter aerophilus]|uniref:Multidrug ABC transporter ATP-binding protein n=1 Tax=Segetibacter aerophilus TaxID=670293 RepID=A0A512BCK3_9BACT|nr:ABC transporter ATP-binding protein [Segetibacter aerophilus]GEO09678.1 multidrug ABC transporter ATP-binding protein [Segetibacter aerophilus]